MDWKKIKAEYIRGGVSYRKLAEKYGVSLSTLTKVAMKEKWADLRKETGKKADAKLSESVASQEAKRVDAFQTLADKLLQHITDNIYLLASNATSVKDITVAIKNLREIKGVKHDIDLKEQEARIAKLIKEAEKEEQKDNEIKVIIEGDLEKYST